MSLTLFPSKTLDTDQYGPHSKLRLSVFQKRLQLYIPRAPGEMAGEMTGEMAGEIVSLVISEFRIWFVPVLIRFE